MKTFTLTLFALLFSVLSFGQQHQVDSVYLKTGVLLIGKVVSNTPNENMIFQTTDSQLHTIYQSDIYKIKLNSSQTMHVNEDNEMKNDRTVEQSIPQNITDSPLIQQIQVDSIYLKNGRILVGTITYFAPNDGVNIKVRDVTYCFQMSDVLKITKNVTAAEDIHTEVISNKNRTETITKLNGVTNHSFSVLDFGTGVGISSNIANPMLKFDVLKSFNVTEGLNFGFGLGFRGYLTQSTGIIIVPAYFDMKFALDAIRVDKFFSIDLGYSFVPALNMAGLGMYIHPALNFIVKHRPNNFLWSIGCEIQTIVGNDQSLFTPNFSFGIMF